MLPAGVEPRSVLEHCSSSVATSVSPVGLLRGGEPLAIATGLLTSWGAGTLPALPSSSAVSSTRYISWRLCGLLLRRMRSGKNCGGTGWQGRQGPVRTACSGCLQLQHQTWRHYLSSTKRSYEAQL